MFYISQFSRVQQRRLLLFNLIYISCTLVRKYSKKMSFFEAVLIFYFKNPRLTTRNLNTFIVTHCCSNFLVCSTILFVCHAFNLVIVFCDDNMIYPKTYFALLQFSWLKLYDCVIYSFFILGCKCLLNIMSLLHCQIASKNWSTHFN